MLGVHGLGKAYGGRTLFENVSLELAPGCRYGVVGANGSGKSTFMKIIAGDLEASEGTVSIVPQARVGVLRQDHFADAGESIVRVAMAGDAPAYDALSKRARIIDHDDGDPADLAGLEERIGALDGYTLEARATSILEGLGIPKAIQGGALSTLSGGFRLRVMLAQVLLAGPDLLLLDEPTNHLDILSIRWLETFLGRHRGVALVISHDQRFLDNVATHILDVDYGTVVPYTGNYSRFVVQKAEDKGRRDAEIERAEKIIAEKRAWVERFGAKATKAKQAQSRLKQIEKIEVKDELQSSRRTPLFKFTPLRPSGRDVLEAKDVKKAYGDKVVLAGATLNVRRGERVGVIGANGLGKSTLVKILAGKLAADAGDVRLGHEARVGYFAQDHHELLGDDNVTPLDHVWAGAPEAATAEVRGELGRMLFSGDSVHKPIGSLSGGEGARVVFARLAIEKPNVLMLDEPTNHLDMEAIASLADGLKSFEGTVIFVSHDRWFVSEVATRIVEVTKAGLRDFPGTFAEYIERSGDDHLDASAVVEKEKAAKQKDAAPSAPPTGLSREEQKRRKNRFATLPRLRDELLAKIDEAEARRKAIATLFDDPGFYGRTPQEQYDALIAEDKTRAADIERLVAEWEEVETEMAAGASAT